MNKQLQVLLSVIGVGLGWSFTDAQAFSVTIGGGVSGCIQLLCGGGVPSAYVYDKIQTATGVTSATATLSGEVSVAPDDAMSQFSGTARLGALSGIANAYVRDGSNIGAFAHSSVDLNWYDTVNVSSTGDFLLSLDLADSITLIGGSPISIGLQGSDAAAHANVMLGSAALAVDSIASHHDSTLLHLHVGDSLAFSGWLALHADTSATNGTGSAEVDASHTAIVHLDPVTAGAGYTTASGVSYLSAVPLPPAVWLFGSGLLGLISVARRKVRTA